MDYKYSIKQRTVNINQEIRSFLYSTNCTIYPHIKYRQQDISLLNEKGAD